MPYLAPAHKPHGKLPKQSSWDKHHGGKTTTQKGYGWAWQKLRVQILRRDSGLCQSCLKAGRWVTATEVDHIKPKAQGGTDSQDNLMSLCIDCHKAKTAKDSRG